MERINRLAASLLWLLLVPGIVAVVGDGALVATNFMEELDDEPTADDYVFDATDLNADLFKQGDRINRGPDLNRVIVTFKDATFYKAALETTATATPSATANNTTKTKQEGSQQWVPWDEGNSNNNNATVATTLLTSWATNTKVHLKFDNSNALAATMSPEAAEVLRNDPRVLAVEKDPIRYMSSASSSRNVRRHRHDGEVVSSEDAEKNGMERSTYTNNRMDISENNNTTTTNNSNSNSSRYGESDGHRRSLGQGQVVPYGVQMVQANKVPYKGGKTVCVIDTGYDVGHEDLPNRRSGLVRGYNGQQDDLPWNVDRHGHGTHVAGTIAAVDNDLGVVGVAPGVNLYVVRVFGDNGRWAYESDIVHAVEQCVRGGADVINLSLGGSDPSQFGQGAFRQAYDKGILLVAAAMNSGGTPYYYPASYDSVVSVAAVDRRQRVADFSQQNDQVELSAPGVSVLSTVPFPTLDASVTLLSDGNYPVESKSFADTGAFGDAVSGPLVDCDLDASDTNQCSTNVRGKVCVIEASTDWTKTFFTNCQAGGASAIVFQHFTYPCSRRLGWGTTVPTVCVENNQARIIKRSASSGLSGRVAVTDTGYQYVEYEGTSMSTPHVAGVAALVWSNHPECSNEEIRQALCATAKKVQGMKSASRDNAYGYGIVKARAANNRLDRRGCKG